MSVGVIDSENFKGIAEIEALKRQTEDGPASSTWTSPESSGSARSIATTSTPRRSKLSCKLCEEVQKEHPRSIFFLGQLVFENDKFYYRFLHNETAFAIQRRLQFAGLQAIVLPIRVLEHEKKRRRRRVPGRARATPAGAPAS